jgi:hypothetical protein
VVLLDIGLPGMDGYIEHQVVTEEIIEGWLAPVSEADRDEEDRRGIQMLAEIEARTSTGH